MKTSVKNSLAWLKTPSLSQATSTNTDMKYVHTFESFTNTGGAMDALGSAYGAFQSPKGRTEHIIKDVVNKKISKKDLIDTILASRKNRKKETDLDKMSVEDLAAHLSDLY